ncbi:hypothetical protein HU200_027794 [Digitaria exilis]|uniref:Proliferating cell nuclear antigen PCNA N-terminal domain-containing protein n=1 Tax=Digitaria exilis TaxID=1010633 RepID=A0A835BTW5_9POAL|nr:hypothetical protein HU200_027794 [Digitaria exilis]
MPATLLKLQLLETTLFKNVLEALGDLFSKANFNFSSRGLEIQAVHSTNTLACSLPAGAFHQYHSNRDLSIEMNLDDLALVFGSVNNDDVLDIVVEDDGFDYIVFSFKSIIITASGEGVRFHTDLDSGSSYITCMPTETSDKVLTGLTLLAPQTGMAMIL